MTLDEAIMVEDALEFMVDGFTVDQHLGCYIASCRGEALAGWNTAKELVAWYGTPRKALNYIAWVIDSHRETAAQQ